MDDFHGRTARGTPTEAAAAWPGGPAVFDSPPTGYGESANQSVQITIGKDGLVDVVKIDPRALRQGADGLAALTRQALRAAQQDWFGKIAQHDPATGAEDRLNAKVEEMQAEYSRRMEEVTSKIASLRRDR